MTNSPKLETRIGPRFRTNSVHRSGRFCKDDPWKRRSELLVITRTGAERLIVEHARSGHEFGEGEFMWRCMECGEMGQIKEGLPDRCTGCDEPKETLMYWTED